MIVDTQKWYRVAVDNPPVPLSDLRARAIGIKRCPRKGEFFLSGSFCVAYQATADMYTEYPIAEVYETRLDRTQNPVVRVAVRRLYCGAKRSSLGLTKNRFLVR